MAVAYSLRGSKKIDFDRKHLNLKDLKEEEIINNYLYKDNIPLYPKPKFHVPNLRHDTDPEGLEGIYRDSGFKSSDKEGLIWFSLAVGPEEIKSAEKRLLEETFQNEPQEEETKHFLYKFATSPTLSETSTYGAFRFTLPLQQVLDAYSQQFCSGERPVMRVYRTSVFPQEVQYIVVVHSPTHESFSDRPLLEDQPEDAVCKYSDGHFLWRSQAMCETHRFEMVVGENQISADRVIGYEQFYVWDQVSIALYLEPEEVLRFTEDQLENLTHCQMFDAPYMKYRKKHFIHFEEAKKLVKKLRSNVQLKKEISLQEYFEARIKQKRLLPIIIMFSLEYPFDQNQNQNDQNLSQRVYFYGLNNQSKKEAEHYIKRLMAKDRILSPERR